MNILGKLNLIEEILKEDNRVESNAGVAIRLIGEVKSDLASNVSASALNEVVNLTPHAINIVAEDGTPVLTIEPSGSVARVSCKTVIRGAVNGIPITANEYGEVEGLPDPQKGTIYIVSALVAGRCTEREDVFIPNESVRNDKGQIIGCKSLGKIN